MAWTDSPTQKQCDYIVKLAKDKPAAAKALGVVNEWDALGTPKDRKQASNWIDALLAAPKEAAAKPLVTPQSPLFAQVPEGHYAVPAISSKQDLDFYRVKYGKGKWAQRKFVNTVVGGHPEGHLNKDESAVVLARILEFGVVDSQMVYGVEIGRCSCCNRKLTDELSRKLGIGPECRTKAQVF